MPEYTKGDCHCCGFEEVAVAEFTFRKWAGKVQLCELCAKSFFATAYEYPDQVQNPTMWRSVAYGINMILREVNDRSDLHKKLVQAGDRVIPIFVRPEDNIFLNSVLKEVHPRDGDIGG
jgi:hypothetical protein